MNRYLQKIASRSGMTNTGSVISPQVLPQRPSTLVDTPTPVSSEETSNLPSNDPIYPGQTPVQYSSKNEKTPELKEPKFPVALDHSKNSAPYQPKTNKELVTSILPAGTEEGRQLVQLAPLSIKEGDPPLPINVVDAIKETPPAAFIKSEPEGKVQVETELINSITKTEKLTHKPDTILFPTGIPDSNPIAEKKTPQKNSLFIGHISVEIIKPENPVKQIRERSVKKNPSTTVRSAHGDSLTKLGFGLGQT